MRVLLISTFELGHQPLHVAVPAAALRQAGHEVRALDLAVQSYDAALVSWAEAVAFSVPMHTAMRLSRTAAGRVRDDRPEVPIAFYGLSAAVGRDDTVGLLADMAIAGEYLQPLVEWVEALAERRSPSGGPVVVEVGRSPTPQPARRVLPGLAEYAHLVVGGRHVMAGAVETSRGCRHRCRHCPVPAVYDGRYRIVSAGTVLADVAALAEAGAGHVTFADPDFLNGPQHSVAVLREAHEAFPDLTFDITTKVELILRHAELWSALAGSGVLFVVSAFETTNDRVLELLDKGHTAADMAQAVQLLRGYGIEVRPSWLPFTPWTELGDLPDILDFLDTHDLVGNVDPVQLTIRLLIPEGSLLLGLPDLAPYLGDYDAEALTYLWRSADPAVDELQARLAVAVMAAVDRGAPPEEQLGEIGRIVSEATGSGWPAAIPAGAVAGRPRLTEPWFC